MSGMKTVVVLATLAVASAMLAAGGTALAHRARSDLVQPKGREVAPMELTLAAYHLEQRIIVVARGKNRTTGYTTRLEMVSPDADPPELVLRNLSPEPGMMSGQAITQFDVSGYFGCEAPEMKKLVVKVAGQPKEVEVLPLSEIPPATDTPAEPEPPRRPGTPVGS